MQRLGAVENAGWSINRHLPFKSRIARAAHKMAPMISDDTLRMIHQFSVDRDWQQFHAPANMAKSVSIEAGELLECFQWSDEPRDGDWEHVYEELADVMIYCIQMADVLGVDLDEIIRDKMAKNASKYPVEASHGSSAKAE